MTPPLLSAAADSAAVAASAVQRRVDVYGPESRLRLVSTDRSPGIASQPPQPAALRALCVSGTGSQRQLDGKTAFVCL